MIDVYLEWNKVGLCLDFLAGYVARLAGLWSAVGIQAVSGPDP